MPIKIAFKLSVAKCVKLFPVYPADGCCMAADDWLTGRLSVQSWRGGIVLDRARTTNYVDDVNQLPSALCSAKSSNQFGSDSFRGQ